MSPRGGGRGVRRCRAVAPVVLATAPRTASSRPWPQTEGSQCPTSGPLMSRCSAFNYAVPAIETVVQIMQHLSYMSC
ncbi:hypothetical protein GE061_016835 [Apolygus lucorum]|uniref:Uncharacterized protein n=1 Tax=Apolygus lucorum TaxID=248454 RepID=A0A6A4JCZ1_APOLU|nr:hypothetical protein GE061_016835 [Apolygus lucorum]